MQYSHIVQVRVCSSKIWKSEVFKILEGKDSTLLPTKCFSFEPQKEMDFQAKCCGIYQTNY